ncbi:MAG: S26 family signal peptidase [Paludibacter sp.]|nr:S26 family signal peptidase [Paludibacter sp.]
MKKKEIILFIVIGIIVLWMVLRFTCLHMFRVPSSAMENTIPRGTYIVAWKMNYTPKQNEIIVYHFPEGDTILVPESPVSYYTMKRMLNKNEFNSTYSIAIVPLNKRQLRVGRCVGLPHDRIRLINSRLYVNDKPYLNPDCKKLYLVKMKDPEILSNDFLKNMNIKPDDVLHDRGTVGLCITDKQFARLSVINEIDSVLICNSIPGTENQSIFPFTKELGWTKDDFGEVTIPAKGEKIHLTKGNIALYDRLIRVYEQNDLKILDDKIVINGKVTEYYIPKMDYYFIVNDNRDYSVDSRFWGFLPENHVYGKILKKFIGGRK